MSGYSCNPLWECFTPYRQFFTPKRRSFKPTRRSFTPKRRTFSNGSPHCGNFSKPLDLYRSLSFSKPLIFWFLIPEFCGSAIAPRPIEHLARLLISVGALSDPELPDYKAPRASWFLIPDYVGAQLPDYVGAQLPDYPWIDFFLCLVPTWVGELLPLSAFEICPLPRWITSFLMNQCLYFIISQLWYRVHLEILVFPSNVSSIRTLAVHSALKVHQYIP